VQILSFMEILRVQDEPIPIALFSPYAQRSQCFLGYCLVNTRLGKQTEIFLDDELALTDMTLEELMNLEVISLNMNLSSKQAGVGSPDLVDGQSPSHQASARSLLAVPHNVNLDLWGRYVDSLPARNVDSYVTLDAQVAWGPWKNLELSETGQNLIDSYHQEFLSELGDIPSTEIKRSVYGQIRWLL
jgi:hypothetical protein